MAIGEQGDRVTFEQFRMKGEAIVSDFKDGEISKEQATRRILELNRHWAGENILGAGSVVLWVMQELNA